SLFTYTIRFYMDSSVCLQIFLQALFNPPTLTTFWATGIILLMLFVSGVMSASEIAYFSLTNAEADNLRESDDPLDNRVAKLLTRPRYLLSTILITNNLVNIGVVVTSYYVTKRMLNFNDLQVGEFLISGYVLEFMWNVIIVTFFLVL